MGKKSRENKEKTAKNSHVCAYKNCAKGGEINILTDKYHKIDDDHWYHEECYDIVRTAKEFLSLWYSLIGDKEKPGRINYAFFSNINDLGYTADYVLFALKYVYDKGWNLNYAAGLKFYLPRDEVLTAYKRMKNPELQKPVIKYSSFRANAEQENSPKFEYKEKKRGFGTIISS